MIIGVLPIPEAPPVTSADKPALISIIFLHRSSSSEPAYDVINFFLKII